MWVLLLVLSSKNQYFVFISFVFYRSVTCLTVCISVYKLATLRSFCDSSSHIVERF